ncbi:hypothetical protein BKA70DRAFT_1261955 [Coprinopsis sp. MPI-PUGE-AT-0042]|nr:hypothetical protein BKA70DRAFT_1261955 [Coprinopsis sp. MPI-PUGE-AT-0042]
MIIPITLASSSQQPLPAGLARLSSTEVVLIELQGALEVEAKVASERNGKFVGTLSVDEKLSKPTLRIGHHLLEGKVQNINKPLAVLHRLPVPSNSSSITFTATSISTSASASSRSRSTQPPIPQRRGDEDGMDIDGMPEESYAEPSTGPETLETQNDEESQRQIALTESAEPNPWMIMGVVKKKIIFSKRPMPIVEMKASSGNPET